jgi:regulator-associated protein of mTOR
VFIWAKILALDTSCQADLVKDGGHLYFLKYLDAPEPGVDNHSRAQAVFVLATVCDGHPRGQALCFQANLLGSLLRWLQVLLPGLAALEAQQTGGAAGAGAADAPGVARGAVLLVKWCCLALGRLVEDAPEAAAVSGWVGRACWCGARRREPRQGGS